MAVTIGQARLGDLSSFESFPDEILLEIFRHCARDRQTFSSLSAVCRRFYHVTSDHTLWKELALSSDRCWTLQGEVESSGLRERVKNCIQGSISLPGSSASRSVPMALSVDGKTLINTLQGDQINVWDISVDCMRNATPKATLLGHRFAVTQLVLSKDNKRLFSAAGFEIKVWDMTRYTILASFDGKQSERFVQLLPTSDNETLFSLSATGLITAWDAASLKEKVSFLERGSYYGPSIALYSNEEKLCVMKGSACVTALWDIASRTCTARLGSNENFFVSWCLSPDKTTLTYTSTAKKLCVVDLESAQYRIAYMTPSLGSKLLFSEDGLRFAVGFKNGRLEIYDTKSVQQIAFTGKGHNGKITALCFSPDGTQLFSTAKEDNPVIKMWNPKSNRSNGTLRGHTRTVQKMMFSQDGAVLISAGSGEIKVWNVASQSCQATLRGEEGVVDSMWLSNSTLFVTNENGTTQIYPSY